MQFLHNQVPKDSIVQPWAAGQIPQWVVLMACIRKHRILKAQAVRLLCPKQLLSCFVLDCLVDGGL